MLREWIARLAHHARLPGLSGEPGAVTELRREGRTITFELSGDGETLHLHGLVASLPPPGLAQGVLFETLLVMNHAAEEPGIGALAIDPRTEQVVFFTSLRAAEIGDYEALIAAVDAFAIRVDEIAYELGSLDLWGTGARPRVEDNMDPMRLHSLFIRA